MTRETAEIEPTLEQGESFSDLSCLSCARRAVRLASSVSNLTSPCNERTWNAKGTVTIMTSPEREAPKTITKRSAALLIADRNYAFVYLSFSYSNNRGAQAYTTFTSCQNAACSHKIFLLLGRLCSGRFYVFTEQM